MCAVAVVVVVAAGACAVGATHDVQVGMWTRTGIQDGDVHIDALVLTVDASSRIEVGVNSVDPGWKRLRIRVDFPVDIDHGDLGCRGQLLGNPRGESSRKAIERVAIGSVDLNLAVKALGETRRDD
jgi:hypothetical protein